MEYDVRRRVGFRLFVSEIVSSATASEWGISVSYLLPHLSDLWGNEALGVWQNEVSTDRRSFEANRGLTYQEAASSINQGLGDAGDNKKGA